MDLVALLTEVALKFASLPGSRFSLVVCRVGGITGREQGLQELCVPVLLRGLGLFLGSPGGCSVGLYLVFPRFIYGKSSLLLSSLILTERPQLWSIICLPMVSARVYISGGVRHRCLCLMEFREMLFLSLPAPILWEGFASSFLPNCLRGGAPSSLPGTG